jgi:DNA-directed RNA polymerase specialized sigma24 family protein
MGYAYREILVLRYVEELSVTEIGEVLNLGESATKMRLLRAREEFWTLQREPTA